MTSYNSSFLFDILTPDVPDSMETVLRKSMTVFQPRSGPASAFSPGGTVPVFRTTFPLFMDRTEALAYKSFLTGTAKGRYGRFWIPSFTADLVLQTPGLSGDSSIIINRCDYSARVFPLGNFRRHIVIRRANGNWATRKVTGVSIGSTTETLTLSSTLGGSVALTDPISFLLLGRLDSDTIDIRWLGLNLALTDMPFVELPPEYP